MKTACCKQHQMLKIQYKTLKESQDNLLDLVDSLNKQKNGYKETTENAVFWLSKIATESDPELANIAIKAINQLLNNIEAS